MEILYWTNHACTTCNRCLEAIISKIKCKFAGCRSIVPVHLQISAVVRAHLTCIHTNCKCLAYNTVLTHVCMYVCRYGWMDDDGWINACMSVWMDGMHAWMYRCMHVWMYVSVYVCMYVFWWYLCIQGSGMYPLYPCIHACMFECMSVGMYVCLCAHMYACMHAWMYVCMFACFFNVRMYEWMYVCTYVRMYVWPLYICMYVSLYCCMSVCLHYCLHVGIYVCMYVSIYVSMYLSNVM